MITAAPISVTIISRHMNRTYSSKVYSDITVGEFIRNCCVNLGIDPDTIDGITRNVCVVKLDKVSDSTTSEWKYNPYQSLGSSGICNNSTIFVEPIWWMILKNIKTKYARDMHHKRWRWEYDSWATDFGGNDKAKVGSFSRTLATIRGRNGCASAEFCWFFFVLCVFQCFGYFVLLFRPFVNWHILVIEQWLISHYNAVL